MSFTDILRSDIAQAYKGIGPTILAAQSGVESSMLWKFVRGGNVRSPTIDRLVAWRDQQERPDPFRIRRVA